MSLGLAMVFLYGFVLHADAVLFGSVGGPKWESLPAEIRRACGEEPDSAQPENETEDPHFHAPRFWAPEFD